MAPGGLQGLRRIQSGQVLQAWPTPGALLPLGGTPGRMEHPCAACHGDQVPREQARATHPGLGNWREHLGRNVPRGSSCLTPVPQAHCLLEEGQAKQGSRVRPGWPANVSSRRPRLGLGGARAELQDARRWAESRARQVPAAPAAQWKVQISQGPPSERHGLSPARVCLARPPGIRGAGQPRALMGSEGSLAAVGCPVDRVIGPAGLR